MPSMVPRFLSLSLRAEQMMRSQLAQAPALYASAPAYQTPSGCHDGGPLDLHPHSSLWP